MFVTTYYIIWPQEDFPYHKMIIIIQMIIITQNVQILALVKQANVKFSVWAITALFLSEA